MTTQLLTKEDARAELARAQQQVELIELDEQVERIRHLSTLPARRFGPTHDLSHMHATQWDNAEAKESWCAAMWKFIIGGCLPMQFSDRLYKRLSQMFMHIAHYNRDGFKNEWFDTKRRRLEWVEHILNADRYGDPAYTWVDVEVRLVDNVKAHIETVIHAILSD